MAGVFTEYLFGRHFRYGGGDAGIHEVDDLSSPYQIHQRDDDQPYKETSATDDQGVFQPDYISETEDGCPGIQFEHKFGLVGNGGSERQDFRGDGVGPQPESGYDEIIKSSYETAEKEGLGPAASVFPADKHLCGGRSLRKRIFSMHFLDEIFPEGYQEEDSEDTSEK